MRFFLLIIASMSIVPFAFANSLDKIKKDGSISVGYRESSIPFSYLDSNAEAIGYSIELCKKVVQDLEKQLGIQKLNIKWVPVTSQTRIPLLTNGTIDLECGSTSNTLERQKQVGFSLNTFLASVRFLTKKGTNAKTLADFKGKTVSTTSGTTSDRYIKAEDAKQKLGLKINVAKDHAEAFLMLETGRAAAFIMDDVLLAGLRANAKKPDDWEIVGTPLATEHYALMLRKDDEKFKKIVDDSLRTLMTSNEIKKLYAKWFESNIPPKKINLNLPLSTSLAELFQSPNDKGN
jgi:glutamate/aspartate transport system substrate-binding protein